MKKNKNYVQLLIAIIIFFCIKILLPTQGTLEPSGASVIGIFAATIYLWLTAGVGWPSLLATALLCFTGIAEASAIWQISWGSFIVPLIITVMMLNGAVNKSGLAQHVAMFFVTRNLVRNKPYVFFSLFMLANMLVAFFMDIIPVVIIFMTIAESICMDLGYEKGSSFSKAVYLSVLWISVVGYAATPIGHGIPLLVLGLIENSIGQTVSFTKYIFVGVPYAIVFYAVAILVLRFVVRPDCSKFKNFDIDKKRAEIKPLTKQAKIVAAAYLFVIIMWILPDIGKYFIPEAASYINGLGVVVPPSIALAFLCLFKVKGRTIIEFSDAAKEVSIPTIIFIVAVTAFSSCIAMPTGGISAFLQEVCNSFIKSFSVTNTVLIAIALFLTIVLTNFISCGVTATLIFSAFAPVLLSATTDNYLLITFGIMVSLMANTAFMTPAANPSCPILYSSNYFSPEDGLKYGGILALAAYLAAIFLIYPYARII